MSFCVGQSGYAVVDGAEFRCVVVEVEKDLGQVHRYFVRNLDTGAECWCGVADFRTCLSIHADEEDPP